MTHAPRQPTDLSGHWEVPPDPRNIDLHPRLFTYMEDIGLFNTRGPWVDNFCILWYRRGPVISTVFRNSSMPWAASTCLDCNEDTNTIFWSLKNAADIAEARRCIALQPVHLDRIARAERLGIRFLFFHVGWTWELPVKGSVGHVTLLCVDTLRCTYGIFDPAGLQDGGALRLKDGRHMLDLITLVGSLDRGPARFSSAGSRC